MGRGLFAKMQLQLLDGGQDMLRRTAIASIFSMLALTGGAQATPKVEGPEYNGVFEARNATTGARQPLERLKPEARMKLRALGFGGGSASYEVRGASSPVRFRASDRIEFIVRVASQGEDPQGFLQFFVLKPTASMRSIQVANAGPMGMMNNKTTLNSSAVAFSAAKYGDNFFKISPVSPLPPGEYMLGMTTGQDGFCFGIDP